MTIIDELNAAFSEAKSKGPEPDTIAWGIDAFQQRIDRAVVGKGKKAVPFPYCNTDEAESTMRHILLAYMEANHPGVKYDVHVGLEGFSDYVVLYAGL
jgi:hypothetical protein